MCIYIYIYTYIGPARQCLRGHLPGSGQSIARQTARCCYYYYYYYYCYYYCYCYYYNKTQ